MTDANGLTNATGISGFVITELEKLRTSIADMRTDISSFHERDADGILLTQAKDELEAIINIMASCTNRILDVTDTIQSYKSDVAPDQWKMIQEVLTHIFEECTFQDLTGQRLMKVMNIIRVTEQAIDTILSDYKALQTVAEASAQQSLIDFNRRIQETKRSMANIKNTSQGDFQFNQAEIELSEVAMAAAKATQSILISADQLDRLVSLLDTKIAPVLQEHVKAIQSACSFHDLISARVMRVMTIITEINRILQPIFERYGDSSEVSNKDAVACLENGPQQTGAAPTQDMIDALFNN